MDRIKYYGKYDLAARHYIEKASTFLENFDISSSDHSISEIIELFNIKRYIDDGLIENGKLKDSDGINTIVGKYFAAFGKRQLCEIYREVDEELIEEFWQIFSNFKTYTLFTKQQFSEFLASSAPSIRYILQNKKLVDEYDTEIKEYLLSNCNNATILLDIFEVRSSFKKNELFLPNSISLMEKEKIINEYVECPDASIGYLEIIKNITNRDVLRVSDKTKLKAKRRIEKETEKFFEDGNGFKIGASVAYSEEQDAESKIEIKNGMADITYSMKWIRDNLDEATLLNNFIYLFEYVDYQMRITLDSRDTEADILEREMGIKAKNEYFESIVFRQKNQIANLQLFSYINVLESIGVSFENVIKWFFTDYLKDEFEISNFYLMIPTKEASFLEKCRTIVPEIESVLKQYNLYKEDNSIDHELLQISSGHLLFSNCESLISKKYVYPNSDDYNRACYYFFSDQCMLSYLPEEKVSCKCFFELLKSRKVRIEEYPTYLKGDIDWLIGNNYLIINNGYIEIADEWRVIIIRDLNYNKVISYLHYPLLGREKIDEMISNKFLKYESSLFSINEQDYFDYHLNKTKFGNSLDLRNMYMHGTQPNEFEDAEIHKYNYIVFLKLMVLIVIKINDDLCLRLKYSES